MKGKNTGIGLVFAAMLGTALAGCGGGPIYIGPPRGIIGEYVQRSISLSNGASASCDANSTVRSVTSASGVTYTCSDFEYLSLSPYGNYTASALSGYPNRTYQAPASITGTWKQQGNTLTLTTTTSGSSTTVTATIGAASLKDTVQNGLVLTYTSGPEQGLTRVYAKVGPQ